MFVLNTSRPLFKNNPQAAAGGQLRRRPQDARARARARSAARPPTSTCRLAMPGFRDERIYPLKGPDLKKARALAKGHTCAAARPCSTRCDLPARRLAGADRQGEPRGDRARGRDQVRSRPAPLREAGDARRAVRHRPHRLDRRRPLTPRSSTGCSTARTIANAPDFGNFSYFNSPKYNRLLDEASRLTGAERYRAYGELDVDISRDAAPAIAVVGRSTRWRSSPPASGCVVMNPEPRPDRGLPQVTRALAATLFAALVLIPAAGTHGIKEGGTFRMAVTPVARFQAIDPALYGLEGRLLGPACGALVSYPDKPLPAGLQLVPELAEDYPVISKDRRTYTFTIRRDARFSNGTPVTARRSSARSSASSHRRCNPTIAQDSSSTSSERRKMLAGKTTTLAGAVAKGQSPATAADDAGPRPTHPSDPAVRRAANAPCRPRGCESASTRVPPRTTCRVRSRRAGRDGAQPLLSRLPAASCRPDHASSSTPMRRYSSASRSGELDYGGGHARPRIHSSQISSSATASTESRVLGGAGHGQAHVRSQHDAAAVQEQRETAAGAQLRREPAGLVREFGPLAATPTDQYLPAVTPGFRNERIYPLSGPDLAEGAGARERAPCAPARQ